MIKDEAQEEGSEKIKIKDKKPLVFNFLSSALRLQYLNSKKLKKLQYAVLIAIISVSLVHLLQYHKLLEQWEYSTWAWRQKVMAKPSPATDKIKIILLDQSSLDWGSSVNGLSWPWPREMYALIISFLQRANVKVIAFDVIYSEPSVYGVEDDQQFAQAIADNPVVMGIFLGRQKQQQKQWPTSVNPSPVKLINTDKWLRYYSSPSSKKLQASFPVDILATASPLLSHVNETADIDGVFRRFSLFHLFDEQVLPSMGLAAFLFNSPDKSLNFKNEFLIGKQKIMTDNQAKVILKFRGKSCTHQCFNAASIIQAELLLQEGKPSPINLNNFKNKYVFFGFSAPGLKDLRPTPISGDYPGVEVHATLLDNLLAHDSIKETPYWVLLSVAFLLALLISFALLSSSSLFSIVFNASLFFTIPIIIAFVSYESNYWFYLVPIEVAVIFSLINAITLNYLLEGRQKRFIRAAFNQYLSVDVIKALVEDPERLKLGGEKRELSILFTDIQGFTTISEKLTPEQLVKMLNEYLTDMTDIVMGVTGGTLDKYEGDAIIAFWNAPVLQPDHAVRICRAALLCQRKLAERRDEFYQMTGSLLYMRVGVHTGDVVVGNFGSHDRFDYTMIGDSANLAARLEGANKFFGSYTMISETTWKQAKHQFIARELGALQVVGRKQPITVYELLGFKGESLSPEIETFNEGLALYKQAKLRQAAPIFARLFSDPVAAVYLKRCLKEQDEVLDDWSPIWVLNEK